MKMKLIKFTYEEDCCTLKTWTVETLE